MQTIIQKITKRPINYVYQAWAYQALSIYYICIRQFSTISMMRQLSSFLLLVFFLFSLAWPVISMLICRKCYYDTQYYKFLKEYEDIYYLKIPQNFLPSPHHLTIYPAFRYLKYIALAVIFSYFPQHSYAIFSILIAINIFEMIYVKYF